MKRMVLESLGPWQTDASQPATPPPLPNTPLPPPLGQGSQPTVFLVDKPGLTQSAVAMGEVCLCAGDDDVSVGSPCGQPCTLCGQLRTLCGQHRSAQVGIDVRDADLYPLSVLNGILNSFGGRLFDEVRSQQGLAYSVSGAWVATPVDHPGLFVAGGETAAAGQFIRAVQV